jgi:hypothetical protein
MLHLANDIQSLTTGRRKSGEFLKQMKKSKRPVVLAVNGKFEAVAQDVQSDQRLLDRASRDSVFEAIRQSIADIANKRTRPARELFNELRRRHGVPR